MPRPNRARSIGGESNLAERIKYEREAEGWSPADLAKKMTESGCSITTSAIYKIEAGERTIKVDELIALSIVFDESVEALLTPMAVLKQEWAEQRLKDLDAAEAALATACSELGDVWVDIYRHGLLDVLDGVDDEDSVLTYLDNRRAGEEPSDPIRWLAWKFADAIQKSAATIVVAETNEYLGEDAVEVVEPREV